MRVQGMRERIHEALEHVIIVHLVQALQVAAVALSDLLDLFPGLALRARFSDRS